MGKSQNQGEQVFNVINRITELIVSEVIENANTTTYSISTVNNDNPHHISFSVSRGKESDGNYTGASVLSGSYQNGKVYLSTEVTETDDYILLAHIHKTMKKIANKEITF